MRIEVSARILELAIESLEAQSVVTHGLAAMERRSIHILRTRALRREANELHAAAVEMRLAIERAERDG